MDDWYLKSLGQVACKVSRATIPRFSSKAELVVYNHMNGATHIVAPELPQVQCFGHNTLTWKGSITMNQDGQRPVHVLFRISGPIACFLQSPRHAFNDRV